MISGIESQPSPLRRRYGIGSLRLSSAAEEVLEHPTLAGLLAHRSVRRFLPQSLAAGVLEALVAAAQSAPSSSNLQAWSVVAVEDPERKAAAARLAGDQESIRQAPVLLLFIADHARLEDAGRTHHGTGEGLDYLELFVIAMLDAALAAQNLVVAAEALGLGTCYIGAARNHPLELADLIGLPPRAVVAFGLVVGHLAAEPGRTVRPRLPQHEVLHRERYTSTQRPEAIAAFDAVHAAFLRGQNLPPRPWSQQVAERVGTVAALRGRHRLLDQLRQRGFPLR